MANRSPGWRGLLATVLLSLALPSAASAATFCVGKPACTGTDFPTLQQAIDAANGNGAGTRDRIEVGVGTFTGNSTVAAGNVVDIVGDDPLNSVLAGTSVNSGVALAIEEPLSTVSNLRIVTGTEMSVVGLSLLGSAEGVRVESPGGASSEKGILFGEGATMRDVDVVLQPASSTGLNARPGGTSGATTTVEDAVIFAQTGIQHFSGRVDVRRTFASGVFVYYPRGGTMNLSSSIARITSMAAGAGALVEANSVDTTLNARHFTVVADPASTDTAGIDPAAFGAGNDAVANVRDAIISGPEFSLRRRSFSANATASADVDYSNYDPAAISTTGDGTITQGPNSLNVDPRFVDPMDDLRLRPDSPLIDRGDPAALGPLDSQTDQLLQPRLTSGLGACPARVDMGALEFQPAPRPPAPAAGASPGQAQTGEPITFAASACEPDLGDSVSFAWSFDDGGTASGASVQHAFRSPGTHTGTVTATDSTGRSATAAATVVVTGSALDLDGIDPRFLAASVANREFWVTTTATMINAQRRRPPGGTTFRYTLSEDARVRIAIEQKTTGRRVGRRCVRRTRRNQGRRKCTRYVRRGTLTRAGAAGPNSVRFSGRIGRKALRRGTYRAVFTATDAAGNVSGARRVSFKVVRRPPRR